MSIILIREQRTYQVEYMGRTYTVAMTKNINEYTETFVYDTNGEFVQTQLAVEIIDYVNDNGGGFIEEFL